MMEQLKSHIQLIAQPKEFINFMKDINQFQWRKSLHITMHYKRPITSGKRGDNVLDVATGLRERQLKNRNQILGMTRQLFLKCPHRMWGISSLPFNGYWGSFSGLKQIEQDYSLLPIQYFRKNELKYTTTHSILLNDVYKENITFCVPILKC